MEMEAPFDGLLLLRMSEKQKNCLITSDWLENMSFFSKNSFLAIVMLLSRKLVQGRGIGGRGCFFATRRRHQRVEITHLERDLDAQ